MRATMRTRVVERATNPEGQGSIIPVVPDEQLQKGTLGREDEKEEGKEEEEEVHSLVPPNPRPGTCSALAIPPMDLVVT